VESLWNEVETENIFQHILNTEGEKHPLYSPENLEACADYILSELKSYGITTGVHEFKVDGFDHTFRNVEGFIGEGAGPELLIVSHYDTVRHAPGANDNGSAIAVMLEAARILSRVARSHGVRDEQGRYLSWHTTAIMKRWGASVAKLVNSGTDAETAVSKAISELMDELQENELAFLREIERLTKGLTHTNWPGRTGLMGSSAWAEQAIINKKEIIGVLCLETMGCISKEKNSQKFPEQIDTRMFEISGTQEDLTVGDFLAVIADGNSKSLATSFCEQCQDGSIALPYACLRISLLY